MIVNNHFNKVVNMKDVDHIWIIFDIKATEVI